MVALFTRRRFLSSSGALAATLSTAGAVTAATITAPRVTMSALIAAHRPKAAAAIAAYIAWDKAGAALNASLKSDPLLLPQGTTTDDLLSFGAEGAITKRGRNRFGLYDFGGPLPAGGEELIRAAERELEKRKLALDIDRLAEEENRRAEESYEAFELLIAHSPADLDEASERMRYLVAGELAGCMDDRRWDVLASSYPPSRCVL